MLGLLLAACSDSPLPKPAIVDQPEEQWPEIAKSMSSRELLDVYRYHLSLKPPHDTGFARIAGVRGKELITLWIDDLADKKKPLIDDPWTYGPLISDAYRQGGYDLCADSETLDKAANAFIENRLARTGDDAKALIGKQCAMAKPEYGQQYRNGDGAEQVTDGEQGN